MMDATLEFLLPALAAAGSAGALFRHFILQPYLAAHHEEGRLLRGQLSHLQKEMDATRREVHQLAGIVLEMKDRM